MEEDGGLKRHILVNKKLEEQEVCYFWAEGHMIVN